MPYSISTVISEAEGFAAELERQADEWLSTADEREAEPDSQDETVVDHEDELADAVRDADVYRLRRCAADLLDLLGLIDTESSASRQHYIDTGRYLRFDDEGV